MSSDHYAKKFPEIPAINEIITKPLMAAAADKRNKTWVQEALPKIETGGQKCDFWTSFRDSRDLKINTQLALETTISVVNEITSQLKS